MNKYFINWFNIFRGSKNYDDEMFRYMLNKYNDCNGRAYMEYRNMLIKQSAPLDFNDSRENLEVLFIEPIQENTYKRILKCFKVCGWDVKSAYDRIFETGDSLLNTISCMR